MSDPRHDNIPSVSPADATIVDEQWEGPAGATSAAPARRGRGLAVGAASLAALALVGGGIAVAKPFGIGGQKDALAIADVVPATATAYAAANLDPGIGQQLEMVRFAMKFPALRDRASLTEQGDVKQELWAAATKSHPCPAVSYDRDVKPWLGDQLAVAQLPGQHKGIVVVRATDEAAARAGMAKLATCWDWKQPGLAWRDGFLVASTSQADADKAVADGTANPLARRAEFTEDFGKVGTQGVLSFWGTREGLQQMAASDAARGAEASNPLLPSSAPSAGQWATQQDFRSAAGTLRFIDGNPEVRVASKATGLQKTSTTHTAIDRLPADTTLAVGVSDGAQTLRDHWTLVTKALQQQGQSVAALEKKANLKLPDDLATLLGDDLRVAVGPVPATVTRPADLPLVVTSKTDAAQLQSLLDRTQLSGAGVKLVEGRDKEQVAGLNTAWAATVAAEKRDMLGEQDAFRAAYPTAEQAQWGFYANIDAFKQQLTASMTAEQKANVAPLQAIGVSSHVEDANYGVMVARVTAK